MYIILACKINQDSNLQIIINRIMFKQSKKLNTSQTQQPSINLIKTIKNGANVPKDMLQFLARQITVLKDISQSIATTHSDIIVNRLDQCVHLIEKKLLFTLGNNPEQYHDYIQDFYQGQMNILRTQLNCCKIHNSMKTKELQSLQNSYQLLIKEKQHFNSHLQSSRLTKNTVNNNNLQQYQQNCQLKKQLDHCRVLLQENSMFIEQQAKAIQLLSSQTKIKDKEIKAMRQKYEQKLISFDNYVNKYTQQTQATIKNLTNEHKSYQIQLKDISLIKIRVLEERANLERQLEMKVEEIQLLTRKILQDQILLGKLQRTVLMKEKLIDELYHQIDSVNGNLSRVGKKQEDFQKLYTDKNQQIMKLQERLRIVNETSEKLEKKIVQLNKKIQEQQRQNQKLQNLIQQQKLSINKTQNQSDTAQRKLQFTEKTLAKLTKQKQRYQKQIKLLQEKYQQLCQRCKQEKIAIKKQIMTEVNQLIQIVKQKQAQVKSLVSEKQELNKQLSRERDGRTQVQGKFEKINIIMTEIQSKIDSLQNENKQLNDAKNLLEVELIKLNDQIQRFSKIQQQFENVLIQKKILTEELQFIRKNQTDNVSSKKTIEQEIQKKQLELEQGFSQQRKQYKQVMNKKDFQIKQLESKIKILQEELRDTTNLFDGQKFKMIIKIKELEQLLKQRYDFSSRFSQHSDGVGS